MQTVSLKGNILLASDIIDALQNIVSANGFILSANNNYSLQLRSQVFMGPALDTPYSRASIPNINHPAIEPNSKSISAILIERQQQLDAVLCEISGLETVIDGIKNFHQQLTGRKEKIIQSMTFHKGLESSLWRLPTEVLSQIFHRCLPEDEYLTPSPNLAPMLLTRICRPWRNVAVDMPSLWCRLHVEIDVRSEDDEDSSDIVWVGPVSGVEVDDRIWQQVAFCYDSWLKRSQGRPLSLAFERSPSTKFLGSLLQPYMNQISSLSIHFPRQAERLQLLLKDVPALRELVVLGVEPHGIQNMTQYISQLPSTMRVLDVIPLSLDVCGVSSLNPIWAHLTHVKISLRHPDAFLHLINLCPNLSSLTVRVARFYEQRTLGPFTHTNIQSLCIIYHMTTTTTSSLAGLFDALSLPNLRVLEACCIYECPWPHEQLRDLFARSKCPLERLIFSGRVMVKDVPRTEYVALIPSLDVVVNGIAYK
ncbi:hypothetical protein EV702DRAFT_1047744 [Suillus placidus]|uniref:F-box domain-containing protein n=1 Tax=Suillus placidus TaxID=48579 RepID=A0A9P6ZPH7_9AGAM|nr:hypothetical protein EV702DRAFT_1047744 [Suillus placidus]